MKMRIFITSTKRRDRRHFSLRLCDNSIFRFGNKKTGQKRFNSIADIAKYWKRQNDRL